MQASGTATANPEKEGSVVVVGPSAAHHKGGVAYFSSQLTAALAKLRPTRSVSWSELYPRWLLSRDLEHPAHADPTELLLAYSNPLSWRNAAQQIAASLPTLVVLNWVHPVHTPVYAYLLRALQRRSSAPRIVVCHNVEPHERFFLDTRLVQFALHSATALVVHSEQEAARARALFPTRAVKWLQLPTFNPFPAEHPTVRSPSPRLLYFGAVRSYKGLDMLLEAMPSVLERVPNCTLTIAGEPFGSYAALLRAQAVRLGIADAIRFDLRYLPDHELIALFDGQPVVVLPFREVTQSASLSLALSSDSPVVTTALPALKECIAANQGVWATPPDDPTAFAEAIVLALQAVPPRRGNRAADESWRRYSLELLDLAGVAQ